MFGYQQKPSLTAKVLTISAIGMGVGFGTCGLSMLATDGHGAFGVLAYIGVVLFFVSLVSLVGTVLVFIVNSVLEAFRR